MGDLEHWKLMADWVMPAQGGPAQPLTVVIGPAIPPGERVEVVRADLHRGAVEALRFYADEANWELHETPSGWSSAAGADEGERARTALGGQ